MENDAEDLKLLYKIGPWNSPIGTGSFNYGNVSFMSQIRLPDGTLVSLPTMAFEAVGDADTETGALGRIFDYARKKMKHYTGDKEAFRDIYAPYTTTPYAPELPWILYVGEAGSGLASAVVTGLSRAVGLPAEQFRSPIMKFRAGFVEADGFRHHYDGNNIFTQREKIYDLVPLCIIMNRTVDNVENREYDLDCDQ